MPKGTKEPTLTISVRTEPACARSMLGNLAKRQKLLRRTGRLPCAVRLSTVRELTITVFSWVSTFGKVASRGPSCGGLTAWTPSSAWLQRPRSRAVAPCSVQPGRAFYWQILGVRVRVNLVSASRPCLSRAANNPVSFDGSSKWAGETSLFQGSRMNQGGGRRPHSCLLGLL